MDTTGAFILITLGLLSVAWLAYDLTVVAYWRPRGRVDISTITSEIQRASARTIAIPFVGGLLLVLLLGHLFLQF